MKSPRATYVESKRDSLSLIPTFYTITGASDRQIGRGRHSKEVKTAHEEELGGEDHEIKV